MKPYSGQVYIVIGFILVLTGLVFPLLMVLHIIQSTFLLNFLSFAASVGGLFLGIVGVTNLVREHRRKR